LAWETVPYTAKTFAQACPRTGTWTNSTAYVSGIGLNSTTNGSTLACPVTTFGGPIYIWYSIQDSNGGTFTYSVDGGSAVTVNSSTSPTISTQNGGTQGMALLRVTGVGAGSHNVALTVTSATSTSNVVGIYSLGTPASTTGTAYQPPSLFVGGVIPQNNETAPISTYTALYNSDVSNNVSLLAGDGLPIYLVNVRNFVSSTGADWTGGFSPLHPGIIGQQHLRDAFASVEQFSGGAGVDSTVTNASTNSCSGGTYTVAQTDSALFFNSNCTISFPPLLAGKWMSIINWGSGSTTLTLSGNGGLSSSATEKGGNSAFVQTSGGGNWYQISNTGVNAAPTVPIVSGSYTMLGTDSAIFDNGTGTITLYSGCSAGQTVRIVNYASSGQL
jgi:hypothetical protein